MPLAERSRVSPSAFDQDGQVIQLSTRRSDADLEVRTAFAPSLAYKQWSSMVLVAMAISAFHSGIKLILSAIFKSQQ